MKRDITEINVTGKKEEINFDIYDLIINDDIILEIYKKLDVPTKVTYSFICKKINNVIYHKEYKKRIKLTTFVNDCLVYRHIEILHWVLINIDDINILIPSTKIQHNMSNLAAERGNLAFLQWLFNKKGCFLNNIFFIALKKGYTDIVEWGSKFGFKNVTIVI